MTRTKSALLSEAVFSIWGGVLFVIGCGEPPQLRCPIRFTNGDWNAYHGVHIDTPVCPVYLHGQNGPVPVAFDFVTTYNAAAGGPAASYGDLEFFDDNGVNTNDGGLFTYDQSYSDWATELVGYYTAASRAPYTETGNDFVSITHVMQVNYAQGQNWLRYGRHLQMAAVTGPSTVALGSSGTWRDSIPQSTSPVTSRQWRVNGVLQGATGPSLTYIPQQTGQFLIEDKAINSQAWDTTSKIVSVIYTVSISGPSSVRSGNSCNWIAQPTGGVGALTYQWYKNGSMIGGNSASLVTSFTAAGNIYVKITDSMSHVTSSATKSISVSASAPLCGT